ncbi:MAG: glycosyltransferase, partial [Desulfobaccales bacterium]
GGPQENVIDGETGVIVPANDEEGLFKAINLLVADPELLRKMGEAARDHVKQRSFAAAFQASWKMYEERADHRQAAG